MRRQKMGKLGERRERKEGREEERSGRREGKEVGGEMRKRIKVSEKEGKN